MFELLQQAFTFLKRKQTAQKLSERELIRAEREKRMPLFGAVFFDNGLHGSGMGPGMRLIKQTQIAIKEGRACEIPASHSAFSD